MLLATHGPDAKPLAGGQSLIPLLNFRMSRPAVLVDLGRIQDLVGVASDDSMVRVGAMTRQSVVCRSETVASDCSLLADAVSHVGHLQIRHRGTIGGSLAHADPAAEIPAVALLLDATAEVRSIRGSRDIPASDFVTGPFMNSLEPDELVVAIRFPVVRGPTAFVEVARRHGDYALAGIAALRDGAAVRLVAFGGGWAAQRLADAEAVASDGASTPERILASAAAAAAEVEVMADVHADAAYRRDLVRTLVARSLEVISR